MGLRVKLTRGCFTILHGRIESWGIPIGYANIFSYLRKAFGLLIGVQMLLREAFPYWGKVQLGLVWLQMLLRDGGQTQ